MKKLINNIKSLELKKEFKVFLKSFKKYAKDYSMNIAFVIINFISCLLLRVFTVGNLGYFKGNLFELSVLILIASLTHLFKTKKGGYIHLLVWSIIITIMNTVNVVYFTFFSTFASFSLLATLKQASTQGGAILSKISPDNLIYIVFLIGFILFANKKIKKDQNYKTEISREKRLTLFRNIFIFGIIFLLINISLLQSKDYSRLKKQWDREYIVRRFGNLVYQGNDLFQTIKVKMASRADITEAQEEFNEFFANKEESKKNNYTNMFKGYNVICMHLESMMQYLIGLEINGQEVTPTLNRLAKESMYFDNFYSQVSIGTSSDTEFTVNTSLLPVQSGTVAVSYYNRTYVSLQKLLKEKNYYAFSMHGNKATMWNRQNLHNSLGYDKFYSQDSYEIDEIVGLGLSDSSFFKQSEAMILDITNMIEASDQYTNYVSTLLMLSNHTPFKDDKYTNPESEDYFDVTYHTGKYDENGEEIIYDYLDGLTVGRYIQSVHYADKCLGEFLDYVRTAPEYQNTVFVMYGDHPAQISKNQFSYFVNYSFEEGRLLEEEDEGYVDYDYYANEIFKKVPFFIWTPNVNKNNKIKGVVSYPMGMVDVLPTIGNMLNFKNEYALGHDIFDIKNDNTVVFANGNYITDKVYYRSSEKEFKPLGDVIIDENYIEERRQYSEKILNISNNIIVYNLIAKVNETSE